MSRAHGLGRSSLLNAGPKRPTELILVLLCPFGLCSVLQPPDILCPTTEADSSEGVKKPAAKEGAKKSAAKEGAAAVKPESSGSLGTRRAASQDVIASVAKQFGAKQFGAAPQAESFMSELDVLNEISAEYEEAGSRTTGQQGAEPQQQEQQQPGKAEETEGRPEKPGRKARQAGEELAEQRVA